MGSRASAKPILRFPERNDEDTFWTRGDETKPVSAKNKFKSEDMTRVRQRKELLWTEVVKNDPTSLVDRWLWDHIKVDRWEHITGVFPQGDKCSPKHKWVLMTTLWICCAHYNCMTVYDVTNSNDTQRNLHLTDHHSLGVTMARLAHLRVARYFIRKMCPFSQCEDASYHEQAPSDWVACCRDTIRDTIVECFLVVPEQMWERDQG